MPSVRRHLWIFALVFLALATIPLHSQTTPPDSTLFTTYNYSNDFSQISWIVCGSVGTGTGCYAFGELGPFVKTGALLEGNPIVSGDVVTRSIYVVDQATGTNGTGVTLYVYKKVDTISGGTDNVSVTLSRTVNLQLTGGLTAHTYMAANRGFLFVGTDQGTQAVELPKTTLKQTKISVTSLNISAITANSYGFVTVMQGNQVTGPSSFGVYNPAGFLVEDGGGAPFMLNTTNAVLTATLPQ
jgi:hypothetical protein